MRFILVHLSDIHFQTEDDVILKRREQLESAIKNLDYEIDVAFIAVTGDLAFSGTEEQYILAYEFFDKLMRNLSQKLAKPYGDDIPVHFVGVPGNHDCDFSEPNRLRMIIAEDTLKNPDNAKNEDVVATSVQVQKNFFDFIKSISHNFKAASSEYKEELIYQNKFKYDGVEIRFICCNTAWLSQMEEVQGKLVFPHEGIPKADVGIEAVTISLFHHPYNWLESTCARNYQKKIEIVSDIILTGHEHDSTRHIKECSGGERNTYIEGGVLQSGKDLHSDFNLFIIDTELKKQKFAHFIWDGTKYEKGAGSIFESNSQNLAWVEYQANQLRQRTLFEISRERLEFLNDPGVMIKSHNNKTLNLPDFYVFPDFREIDMVGKISETLSHGDDFVNILNNREHVIITGNEQAGKTSLAKMLFLRFHEAGKVPIYIDGSKHISENFNNYFEKLFTQQYEKCQVSDYQNLDKNRRVIIIDDYHKVKNNPRWKNKLISSLICFAGKIILIGQGMELTMDEFRNPVGFSESRHLFSNFGMQQFGLSKRNRLVEKWLLLNPDEELNSDPVVFAHKSMAINRTLNEIIGRNLVPSYPIYIVSVLNTSDAAFPVDTRASHQAYYYELFIRMALLQGRTEVEYDLIATYLSNMAFALFNKKVNEVDINQLRDIHSEYETRYDIQRPFERMIGQLENQRILDNRNGIYKFKYKFIYYYFVATYLRDHIVSPEIKSIITELSGSLHIEECSNILHFLTHLSKDPLIVESLVTEAGKHFDELTPATFTDDVSFLYSPDHDFEALLLEDRDAFEARNKMLEKQDSLSDKLDNDDEYRNTAFSLKLISALKTLQILGQILKNFPGSMESSDKISIMDTCVQLGLRIATSFFEFVKATQERYLEYVVHVLKEDNPDINYDDLKKRAIDTLNGFTEFMSFCLVKKISYDLGSQDLFKTYENFEQSNISPALRTIIASIKIDHKKQFPIISIEQEAQILKAYPLAFAILRMLVFNHFTLFPVDYKIRQRLCRPLKIKLVQSTIVDPDVRLISPKS